MKRLPTVVYTDRYRTAYKENIYIKKNGTLLK